MLFWICYILAAYRAGDSSTSWHQEYYHNMTSQANLRTKGLDIAVMEARILFLEQTIRKKSLRFWVATYS